MRPIPTDNEFYLGLYRFAAGESIPADVVTELNRRRRRTARMALFALLVATAPFWIIVPIEMGLVSNMSVPAWTAIPALAMFFIASMMAMRAAFLRRLATERSRCTILWRFELLEEAREEISAQRAIGKIPPEIRIAEYVRVFPTRVAGLASVENDIVDKEIVVRISTTRPVIAADLRGVMYRSP